ncbi:fumarylacetoacetate hydrolase family protein [Kyrpidia spormannii]|nr:fumarylacetoacetate hydrolase family protein [Kyrpidia spormannii]CAB3391548.1 2-keto-4-pentenoate hydratase/2-oxohepta-3-ene-1,7-dioic acid hydratase (Catechol pathway) [Kyrpidia spormannii]
MRLVTVCNSNGEELAVRLNNRVLPVRAVNALLSTDYPAEMRMLLESGRLPDLVTDIHRLQEQVGWVEASTALSDCRLGPLYRHPRKIWGIGLNYREHAGDLGATPPMEEPASFMKADTTIIGPGDEILLPSQSDRVTAEAEIAVVIGRRCRDIAPEEAPSVVAGFVPVLDMTAEDILQKNPRFLTRAKNFDTFFSFGPELVTVDEVEDLAGLKVGTYLNSRLHRENVVANMIFDSWFLVSFHSRVMTFEPGDILSTGTPGAAIIRPGDQVECRITGFLPLVNPVGRYEPAPSKV